MRSPPTRSPGLAVQWAYVVGLGGSSRSCCGGRACALRGVRRLSDATLRAALRACSFALSLSLGSAVPLGFLDRGSALARSGRRSGSCRSTSPCTIAPPVAGWSFEQALVVVGWFTLLKGVLDGAVNPSLVHGRRAHSQGDARLRAASSPPTRSSSSRRPSSSPGG